MADDPDIGAMAEWLADPSNAEPCAKFPTDPERVSGPGMYAWHGDDVAVGLVIGRLGGSSLPLYVDQAGSSRGQRRTSGATLKSTILRHHLHGSSQASQLRRSLGAVLWEELDLRCERPRVLDAESSARLTAWMLEHLSVATIPVAHSDLSFVGEDIVCLLDPVLNLVKHHPDTPGRKRLRLLRRRHFSIAGADAERVDRLRKLHAFAAKQESGGEFLKRRLQQEQRRCIQQLTQSGGG